MLLKKNKEKISKIERGDSFLVCFRGLFWSLGVCVGGIVSDYCMFKLILKSCSSSEKSFWIITSNRLSRIGIAKPQISDDHSLKLWVGCVPVTLLNKPKRLINYFQIFLGLLYMVTEKRIRAQKIFYDFLVIVKLIWKFLYFKTKFDFYHTTICWFFMTKAVARFPI